MSVKVHTQTEPLLTCIPSPTSISVNRSIMLTGSSRSLKLSPDPTVTPRTGLPTTVITEALVVFVIGKSIPVSYTTKTIPTFIRSSIRSKREGGRNAAAVGFTLRVLVLAFSV